MEALFSIGYQIQAYHGWLQFHWYNPDSFLKWVFYKFSLFKKVFKTVDQKYFSILHFILQCKSFTQILLNDFLFWHNFYIILKLWIALNYCFSTSTKQILEHSWSWLAWICLSTSEISTWFLSISFSIKQVIDYKIHMK